MKMERLITNSIIYYLLMPLNEKGQNAKEKLLIKGNRYWNIANQPFQT